MKATEKKLLGLFRALPAPEQETLTSFAEFLKSKMTATGNASTTIPEPQLIPRPGKESIVAAIKRLSASYSMLNSPKILNETSTLMTQHVMQGRGIEEVIDDLEQLFRRHYKILIDERNEQKNGKVKDYTC